MKKTIALYLDESLINHFERERRKYAGSKGAWMASILRPVLNCISEAGIDEFKRRLKTPTSDKHPDIDGI